MLSAKKRFLFFPILVAILASFPWSMPSARACEIALPSNYLYEEHLSFEESRLPPGLTLNFARPDWVVAEGPVGFVQLENSGPDDIYLLYAFEIADLASTLSDGQKVGSSIWTRGLALNQGNTFDILGEGTLMQFAPGLVSLNVNNTDGGTQLSADDPPPAQSSQMYFVSNQKLYIVPFTVSYRDNPAYKPEGSFHPYTLDQKVDSTPFIVLGVAQEEAGYDSSTTTTVRVEQWLKGRGRSEIVVSGFGGTSCDYQIGAGARHVFFLAPEDDGYRLSGFQAGMFDALTWPTDASRISEIAGQSPYIPEPDATLPAFPGSLIIWAVLVIVGAVGSWTIWRRTLFGRGS